MSALERRGGLIASIGLEILWRLQMNLKSVLRALKVSRFVSGLPRTVVRNASIGSGRRGRVGQHLANGLSLPSYHSIVLGLRSDEIRLAINSRTACSVLMVEPPLNEH
ncbi:hypothetical protein ES708_22415 [subsurface metagenome]